MNTIFKRIFSLLMVLALVGAMIPVITPHNHAAAAENDPVVFTAEDYAAIDDLFAQIDAMEDAPAKKNATEAELADAAAKLVEASANYVEGSLERNGNNFTWWTDEGIRCVYSPRMREINDEMVVPEESTADGIYNEPVAVKGGWPSGNQVYLIGPYYGYDESFTDQYKNEAKAIATAIGDTDGYTLYSGTSATVDKVAEAVENGAVVIFDSHGNTDYENGYDYVTGATSSYLCLKSTTGLTDADYADGALYDPSGIWINGATIANHMTKNSPSGLLWMAICLGMATDTFAAPMREMGVEVVYGYSQSVTFAGDYLFEETFWDNMIAGKDVATSVAAMKSTWGNWDWSTKIAEYYSYDDGYTTIGAARSDYSAFPIVVSDEDAHPGQRNGNTFYGADSLQTVKSTYTLFSQYNVTAQSNNTGYGTVSTNGSTITAVPATGYFAQSATVLSGTATVTQNGNTFSVMAESDCVVQINFAAKTPVTVSFSGAPVAAQNGYSGDAMTLPTAGAPEGYKFLGWTTAPLSSDTTEKPTFYTDSYIPNGNVTLYALYSYVDENSSSGSGDYVKVTESRDDWSGEYLIVYENDSYIFNGSLTSFDATSNFKAVTITDNTIAAAEGDAYRFTIAAMDGGYSIQGASGKYIGQDSNANGLKTYDTAAANTISLDATGNANIIGTGGAYLRYNATANQWRFRYYKSGSYSSQKPIALYLKDGSAGTTYYTSTTVVCEHTNTSEIAAVAATCTTVGYTAGVQCDDCNNIISGHEIVNALGHSWGEWLEITTPGCTTAGDEARECEVCGEMESQTVAATGHVWGEWIEITAATCTTDGEEAQGCENCSEVQSQPIPATGHTMGNGTVTNPATCVTDGVMSFVCTTCGTATTEAIPATGHSYVQDGLTYTCSVCGDSYTAAATTSLQYVFGNYPAGVANAQGENHTLDDVMTLTVNGGYLTSQLRVYAGSNVVFASTKVISSVVMNAGYKASTLNVYGSEDGETWTLVSAVTTASTYSNYTLDMPADTSYKYMKLEAPSAQIRIKEMTIVVSELGTVEPGPVDPEPGEPTDPTEPTEPTEPDVTDPSEPSEPSAPVTGTTYVKITSADQLVSGQYVMIVPTGFAPGVVDDTWITAVQPVVSGDVVTDAQGGVWTLTISGTSVTLQDSNGVFIAPKGGNNNGLASKEYAWAWAFAGGEFTFSGTGSDTVMLASNQSSDNQFRAYKTTTANGYPHTFTLYKLVESVPEVCTHANTTTTTVDATCTSAGSVTVTCDDCGEVISTEEIAILSHTYGEGVVTAPTTTTGGYTTYTCSVCGHSYQDNIKNPLPVNLRFVSAYLTMESDLALTFQVGPKVMAGYENIHINFNLEGSHSLDLTADDQFTGQGGYASFRFPGIAPRNLNTNVAATIYGTFEGVEYSYTMNYAASTYCYNQLRGSNAKFNTLIVDLLNYCAAHQIYTDTNVENLANARLTEAQQAYGTQTVPEMAKYTNVKYETIESPKARFASATLSLKDAVVVRCKLVMIDTTMDINDVTVKITNDKGETWTIYSSEFEGDATTGYYLNFRDLKARQMRDLLYFTICENGEAVSHTMLYSIESYAGTYYATAAEALKNVLLTMMRYSDSADAYTD